MTAKHRAALLSLIAVLVLLLNLIVPVTAFADEGTPPPEETSQPETPPASDPTEAPVQPATEEPAEGPTEAPADEPSVDEPVSVPEILEQVPEGTDLVVLDEQGEIVPLAEEEAAEILATGDPLWCPDTAPGPTPGANGCTAGYTSMALLLADLSALNGNTGPGANGTIWIEDSYDSAVNDPGVPDFTIDGLSVTNWSGYDLIIQGGWSGAYGDNTITGTSAFNGALVVSNWAGNLTLNDLILYDTDGSNSLNLQTSGDVSLDNVEAVDNELGSGALIDTTSGSGDVTITDSHFNDNEDAGLIVNAGGGVTLSNVYANGNENDDGALLEAVGDVVITGGTFNANGGEGIDAYSSEGGITISGLDAQANDSDGLLLVTDIGAISVSDGVFNSNGGDGIDIGNNGIAGGNVNIDNVIAMNNEGDGVAIDSKGDVDVRNSVLSDQYLSGFGLYVADAANVTLVDLLADWNYYGGAYIRADGTVDIIGSVFNNNDSFGGSFDVRGLDISAGDHVTLTGVQASGNEEAGLYITSSEGDLYIDGGTFNANGQSGLFANLSDGAITMLNVQANNNDENGFDLNNFNTAGNSVGIANGDFSYNGASGIVIDSAGNVVLIGVTADANQVDGAFVDNLSYGGSGALNIFSSQFNQNVAENGLELYAAGELVLGSVTANFNGAQGAYLYSDTASVTLEAAEFNANGSIGFIVDSAVAIYLTNVSAGGNAGYGGDLDAGTTITDMGINSFNNNGATGASHCFSELQVNSGTATLVNCYDDDTNVWFTSGFVTYSYLTIADALTAIDGGLTPDDGALHIDAALTPYLDDIILQGTDPELGQITQIVGGGSGATLISGELAFFDYADDFGVSGLTFSEFIEAYDNVGDLGLTDITVAGLDTSGNNTAGIDIYDHEGAIALSGVTASGIDGGSGLFADNTDASDFSTVSIEDSQFDGNAGTGVTVRGDGDITLNEVTASFSAGGAVLGNDFGVASDDHSVSVSSSEFNYSYQDSGLAVNSFGDIAVTDVSAVGNEGYGAVLLAYGDSGVISVGQSGFDDSHNEDGLEATIGSGTDGSISLVDVFANNSGSNGVDIDHQGTNSSGDAAVSVVNGGFNYAYGNLGLSIDSAAGGGIYVENVTANGNYGTGADIDTCQFDSGSGLCAGVGGPISVIDSAFNASQEDQGLYIQNAGAGDITLSNLTVDSNAEGGLYVENPLASGSVTLTNGEFNNNGAQIYGDSGGSGLQIYNYDGGDITVTNVVAEANGGNGAILSNSADGYGVVVDPSTFNNNAGIGLEIYSAGDITLADVTANENGSYGAFLDNKAGTDGITISGVNSFNDNGGDGLSASSNGAISLANITASANQGYGAYLDNAASTDGITISGVNVFNGNSSAGLSAGTSGAFDGSTASITAGGNGYSGVSIDAFGDIDLNDLVTGYNVLSGAYLSNLSGVSSITVTGVNVFNGNGAWGAEVASNGAITLYDVTAGADANSGNFLSGVFLQNIGGAGDISVYGGSFAYNGDEGLYIESSGGIAVYNVFAGYNDAAGVFLQNDINPGYTVLVDTGSFTNNIGDGLTILSAGDVDLTDLTATGNTGEGVSIDNTAGSGSVDLAGASVLSGNDLHGLLVYSDGQVTLNDVSASGNGDGGAYIDNSTAASAQDVTLTGTNTFNGNDGTGLEVNSAGAIAANDLTASGNNGEGALLLNTAAASAQSVTLTGTNTFNGNTGTGLQVESDGAISASNVNASGNTGSGAQLFNQLAGSPQDVTLTGTNALNGNGLTGLDVRSQGEVTLNNVSASGNTGGNGLYVDNKFGSASDVTLTGTNVFNGNQGTNLAVFSHGAITLNNIAANGSAAGDGAYLDNLGAADGTAITLTGTNGFNGNRLNGLFVFSEGAITAYNVSASGNQIGSGAYLNNTLGTGGVSLTGVNVFNGNGDNGLMIHSAGDVHLTDVDANGNTDVGAYIQNDYSAGYSVTVDTSVNPNASYNGNGSYGLFITSAGEVTLQDVVANGNGMMGAHIDNDGVTGYGVNVDQGLFNFNTGSNGLTIFSGGNVSLTDVEANSNASGGTVIFNDGVAGYDVTVQAVNSVSNFNSNNLSGLAIFSGGDITLAGLTASYNGFDGAFLNNCGWDGSMCAGSGTGSVLVELSTFNDNDQHGLNTYSFGDITLTDVTANYNNANGAVLDNCGWNGSLCTGTGDTSVSNSNFDSNTSTGQQMGLEIWSYGDVTLDTVSASNNLYGDGADVYDFASLSVQNSTFNGNYSSEDDWGWGLYADGYGNVTLTDVIASGNGSAVYAGGVYVETDGNISIDPSQFNDNVNGYGLELYAGGDILLDHVTADGNDYDGAYLDAGGDATVLCSQFNNNGGYGVDGSAVAGALTFEDVTLTGNASGPFSGSPIITSGPCGPPPPPDDDGDDDDVTPPDDNPDSIIPVTGGSAKLDCTSFAGTTLQLATGDSLTFLCPTQGDGSLESLEADGLPGDLPEGFTFASGLNGALDGDSEPLPGRVIVSFVIPDDLADADLAILFWNGSEWLDLAEAVFDDGRTVYDGGHATDDGRFEAATNFTGIFVLAGK